MVSIVEFLTARLDEAEAAWNNHRKNKNIFALPCPSCGRRIIRQSLFDSEGVFLYHEGSPDCFLPMDAWRAFADDGPAGDPRDLADIAAKRAILALHADGSGHECIDGYYDHATIDVLAGACPTTCILASVYSDHPDYRSEWKP